ncbi:outer membrane protein OmpK [Zobellella aerophila]|uniref:Outer membrane protein OmpK n=1 Tax=Zobellella aerophila TaxID=870480 RepID=A0ABP6VL31_9GAMM
MAKRITTAVAAGILTAFGAPAVGAADYSDDIHKNDYKWLQFNLMRSVDNKLPFRNQEDTYMEMEFGGRSGLFDLYGYLDVFDIFDSRGDDLNGKDNFFFKFAPRLSLDALTKTDLSFGPVLELYIATVTNVADNGAFGGLFEHYVGLGSDVQVPWLGKMGLNLYGRYVRENYGAPDEGKFDGYMASTNWFKPFHTFENGSFVAYQGYLDYKFGADTVGSMTGRSSNALEWFNGIYWHSERYAVGYGAKLYNNMAFFQDSSGATGVNQDTSGLGHYFSVTYKF